MSYKSYYPLRLQIHPPGNHGGYANCFTCRDRIPKDEARIGWHGHFYHVACWWSRVDGPKFVRALMGVLTDDMLMEAGLKVEPEPGPWPTDSDGALDRQAWLATLKPGDEVIYRARHATTYPDGSTQVIHSIEMTSNGLRPRLQHFWGKAKKRGFGCCTENVDPIGYEGNELVYTRNEL